jgi:hypothetical protein
LGDDWSECPADGFVPRPDTTPWSPPIRAVNDAPPLSSDVIWAGVKSATTLVSWDPLRPPSKLVS